MPKVLREDTDGNKESLFLRV